MSFTSTGVLSASLSPTTIITPPGGDQDGVMFVFLRTRSTALLSTVAAVLTFTDELGQPHSFLIPALPLNALTQSAKICFPFRLGGAEVMTLETLLVGGGTYEILWNYISV
jgi:hypothetical protein